MPHTVTTQDADILNRHAKRGDTKALGKALDDLAQREAPYGIDRAEILLLAKDEAGDNVVHAACAYGNEGKLQLFYKRPVKQTPANLCLQTSSSSFADSMSSPSSPAVSVQS